MPTDYVQDSEFWKSVQASLPQYFPPLGGPQHFPVPSVPASDEEVSMVSSTGAEKGSKLARYDLIPAGPLKQLAEHFGQGAKKYRDRNWEAGYDWSLSFAAMMRHAWAFWGGEDIDEETGTPHIIAAAWHAFALAEYMKTHKEFDNRPTTLAARESGGEA